MWSDRLNLLGECTKVANENKRSKGADEHRLVLYFRNSFSKNVPFNDGGILIFCSIK